MATNMLGGGARLGPYDIIGQLGAGGMGVVYRARDARLSRDVAIKVLPAEVRTDPDRLRRFEQEARAAGSLNHPNLVVVFDVGEHEGTPYIVTELLEGETLRDRLAKGPIPWRKAAELGAQIARGLAAAHEKGVVHRDLKPDNVIVTLDGRAKILDFGLARAVPSGPAAPNATLSQTASGQVLGTAGYMSPEQVRAQPATAASDLFAFGAMLYEMLTGARAFPGETPVERGYAVLSKDVPPVAASKAEAPAALERLMRRCLEKSPDERYHSARDLAFALEGLAHEGSSSQVLSAPAPPLVRAPPARPAGRVLPWLIGSVTLISVTAIVTQDPDAPPGPPAPAPEVVQPKFTRINFRRGTVDYARFGPDGRTVIYESFLEGRPGQIFSAVPGSPSAREIAPAGAGLLDVSAQGELALGIIAPSALARGRVLARAPLAGGAPRQELEEVGAAAYGPDGKQLAVTRLLAGHQRLEYPPGTPRAETTGWMTSPRVSRDGKHLAWLEHPVYGDDRGTVEVLDLQTNQRKRLAGPWYSVWGLSWAPKGGAVWFAACDKQQNDRELYEATLDGEVRKLYAGPGTLYLNDTSPDGRALVTRQNVRMRIGSWQDHGRKQQDLSWFDGSAPVALSRDGKKLLFAEGLAASGGEVEVWLRPIDGGDAVKLSQGLGRALSPDGSLALVSRKEPFTTLTLVPTGPGQPRDLPPGQFVQIAAGDFSADGKFIAFLAGVGNEEFRLWVQDLAGGTPRSVSEPGVVAASQISRTGVVAFQLRDGTHWKIALPDGKPERFDALSRLHIPLTWSKDGKTLYLRVVPPSDGQVHPIELAVLELASGKLSQYATITPPDALGLGPDMLAVRVSEDGATVVYAYIVPEGELYVVEGLR